MVRTIVGVRVLLVYGTCCLGDSDLDAGIHSHSRGIDQFGGDEYRDLISVEVCLLPSYSDWGPGRMDKILCPEIPQGP